MLKKRIPTSFLMAAETIPQYCTRADEWNTSIVKGFIAKLFSVRLFPSNLEVQFTSALSWPARNINTDVYNI